jgi:hypothetical protein
MTNAIKMLWQMQNGFLQLESTLVAMIFAVSSEIIIQRAMGNPVIQ